MKSLGLISEGITDQVVILNILYGYFNTNDVELTAIRQMFGKQVISEREITAE